MVAQYQNPDPFTNSNQKFVEFMENIIFVNIGFKMKSKQIVDSPHKLNLVKALSN